MKRPEIEEEIRNAYAARNYLAAHAALDEWWKIGHLDESDTAFLTLAGDLCNRLGDQVKGDQLEEYLAEHGTPVQCSRAIRILYKRWLGTPKQIRLTDLYRHVLDRFPALKDDQEMEDMGRKLME